MNKEITFVIKPKTIGPLKLKVLDVDLSILSEDAKMLAENILTTENRDDLSDCPIEGPTQRELWDKAGKEVEKYEKAYGSEYFDKPTRILWRWDCLKDSETPEEYFERHALKIRKEGGNIQTSQWGGRREGSGRPSTGRKKHILYITEEEHVEVKKLIDTLRKAT